MCKKKAPDNTKRLPFPVFAIANYKNKVLLGGGGGGAKYGIRNYFRVYQKETTLKQLLWEEVSDNPLVSYIDLGSQDTPLIITCRGSYVVIYEIEDSGDLIELCKVEADFHNRDPLLKMARFSYENRYVVAGGNDGCVRVFTVKGKITKKLREEKKAKQVIKNYTREIEEELRQDWKEEVDDDMVMILKREFKDHYESINSVDISRNLRYLASCSNDKTCRVYSLATGIQLAKLTFSPTLNSQNLIFKGCRFSNSSKYLYTLQTAMKTGSFVTKWDPLKEFETVSSIKVHREPSTFLSLSKQGLNLAVATADGQLITVNTRYMDIDKRASVHNLAVTSANFTCDDRFILTTSADNFYQFSANVRDGGMYLIQIRMLIIFSCLLYYLYLVLMKIIF